jgi:hypothetical protein
MRALASRLTTDAVADWSSHAPVGPEVRAIALACHIHVDREKNVAELEAELKSFPGHPLWPALCRHVARISTDGDRELLTELARNPDSVEPPLRWALQYYVRGDIVLANFEEVSLDALCAHAGLPPLPYLEPMPATG